MKRSDLVLSLGQRLLLLLFIFIVCYGITLLGVVFLTKLLSDRPDAALRIGAVLQDLLTFIVPAVATAVIVTRKPAELLCLQSKPSLRTFALIIAMLIVSVPIQENIIYWNYYLELPSAFDGIAHSARQLEDTNFETMRILLGDQSVIALIVNLLIVGVAAGFSEELLFRGCFQRLLTTGGINVHVAIWTVAFIFSAMHFQFYGFVPRMLLGAYFGYLLLWTRSLWAPILAHVLNNTMFVVMAWKTVHAGEPLTNEPVLYEWPLAVGSAALSALILLIFYKYRKQS